MRFLVSTCAAYRLVPVIQCCAGFTSAQASVVYRSTLQARIKACGWDDTDTLNSANNLSNALLSDGKAHQAADIFRETLRRQQKLLGRQHTETIKTANNLAFTLLGIDGAGEEALVWFREVVAASVAWHGPGHPHTLAAKNSLAGALFSLQKFTEAM